MYSCHDNDNTIDRIPIFEPLHTTDVHVRIHTRPSTHPIDSGVSDSRRPDLHLGEVSPGAGHPHPTDAHDVQRVEEVDSRVAGRPPPNLPDLPIRARTLASPLGYFWAAPLRRARKRKTSALPSRWGMCGRSITYQGPHVPHGLACEDVRKDLVQCRVQGGGGQAGREFVVPGTARNLRMHKWTCNVSCVLNAKGSQRGATTHGCVHRAGQKTNRGDEVLVRCVEALDVRGHAVELSLHEHRPALGAEQHVTLCLAALRAACRPEAFDVKDLAHAQAHGAASRLHDVDPEVRVERDVVGEGNASGGCGCVHVGERAARGCRDTRTVYSQGMLCEC